MSYDPRDTIDRLAVWDVVYPRDLYANPAKHKMWVCVSRMHLWFLRINTLKYTAECVLLTQVEHLYLTRDSYFGSSGDLIAPTEVDLEDRLREQLDPAKQGIVGCIHANARSQIISALRASPKLAPSKLRKILEELH